MLSNNARNDGEVTITVEGQPSPIFLSFLTELNIFESCETILFLLFLYRFSYIFTWLLVIQWTLIRNYNCNWSINQYYYINLFIKFIYPWFCLVIKQSYPSILLISVNHVLKHSFIYLCLGQAPRRECYSTWLTRPLSSMSPFLCGRVPFTSTPTPTMRYGFIWFSLYIYKHAIYILKWLKDNAVLMGWQFRIRTLEYGIRVFFHKSSEIRRLFLANCHPCILNWIFKCYIKSKIQ